MIQLIISECLQGKDAASDKYHRKDARYDCFQETWNSEEMVNFRSVVNDPEKMWEGCKYCYQSSHSNCNRKTSFLQIGQEFAPSWEEKR